MKKFITRLWAFLLPMWALILVGIYMPPTPRASKAHLSAQADKNRLLRDTPSPRIILVGGSNISMSLNSQMIAEALMYHPVNTGLSASIGLLYMLNNTLPYVRKHDIVIVCPEYSQFYDGLYLGTEDLTRVVLDESVGALFKLHPQQIMRSIKYIPRYALSKFKFWEYLPASQGNEQVYLRASFNKYGDMTSHWFLPSASFSSLEPTPHARFDSETMKYLQSFRKTIEDRGAHFFVTYPALQQQSFDYHMNEIIYIEEQFHQAGFATLGTPSDYIFTDSLMYDTPYHLTKQGVDQRTRLLIDDVVKALLSSETDDKKIKWRR